MCSKEGESTKNSIKKKAKVSQSPSTIFIEGQRDSAEEIDKGEGKKKERIMERWERKAEIVQKKASRRGKLMYP